MRAIAAVGARSRRVGDLALVAIIVLGPLLATLPALVTWDEIGRLLPAMWYLAAVLGVCLVGGLLAGLATAAWSAVLLVFVFTEPRWSLRVEDERELRAVYAFLVASVVVCAVVHRLQSQRDVALDAVAERDRYAGLLDGLLDNAPVGLAFFDRELRYVRVNEEMARINGVPVADHLGKRMTGVLRSHGERGEEILRSVRESGTPVLDLAVDGTLGRTDQPLHVVADTYPVFGPGREVVGVGLVVRDVTSRVDAELGRQLLFERVVSVQGITAALAAADGPAAVARALVAEGGRSVGATSGAVVAAGPGSGELAVLHAEGYPEDAVACWAGHGGPAAAAIATGLPVLLRGRDALVERFPEVAATAGRLRFVTVVALPLVVDGQVVAALGLEFVEWRGLDEGEQTFLAAVAGLGAAALERARLAEAEAEARADARRGGDRLAFLADASAALVSSFDWEATMGEVARLAVPRLADSCSVYVVEGDEARVVAVAHRDPERAGDLRELVERYPPSLAARSGIGRLIAQGKPDLLDFVEDEVLERLARDPEHLRLLQRVGFRSGLVVPLRARGEVVGAFALTTTTEGGRWLGQEDLRAAEELASRAEAVLTNALLYRERAHVARVLQESLLPPRRPQVEGLQLATRFTAGGEGVDVGGDFFDAFPVGTAPGAWAVVIGDVRGKGVEAAALTGTARNTLRSAALTLDSPSAMLAHLNRVLVRDVAERPSGDGGPPLLHRRPRLPHAVARAGRRGARGGRPPPAVRQPDLGGGRAGRPDRRPPRDPARRRGGRRRLFPRPRRFPRALHRRPDRAPRGPVVLRRGGPGGRPGTVQGVRRRRGGRRPRPGGPVVQRRRRARRHGPPGRPPAPPAGTGARGRGGVRRGGHGRLGHGQGG